ncbi:MAG: hypothetical protein MJ120_01575 [Clostridia bacterium]|nr:hypothetical protein [Clostridia bacterium]
MKKEYKKPVVVIQDLSVNNFVAGACAQAGGTIVNSTESSCTYTDPSSYMTFFSSQCDDGTEWSVNIVNPNPASPFAQLCYHRPMDSMSFFSS